MPTFPNWTGWKWVKLSLFILGTVDGALIQNAANEPASLVSVAQAAVMYLGIVGMIATTLSGTNVSPGMALRASAKAAVAASVALFLSFAFTGLVACHSSVWQELLSSVESGLENGSTLAALEQIVARYFPQYAADAAVLDTILQSVVTLLQSTGVLTPAEQLTATALQSQITVKLAAAKKSGWVLPFDAAAVVAGVTRGEHSQLVAAVAGRVAR
jgi:hypothetical protein